MNEKVRCWICRRNEEEVREDYLTLYDEDISDSRDLIGLRLNEAIEHRDTKLNEDLDLMGEPGNLIRLVESEDIRGVLPVPLCIICHAILLHRGTEAAYMVIADKILQGEIGEPARSYKLIPLDEGEG